MVEIYNLRNESSGIYNNGSFAIVNFTAIASGTSYVNLNEVIWVNSTITNISVGTYNVSISNATIVVNVVSSSSSSSSGGSGGGGSSSSGSGGGIIPIPNVLDSPNQSEEEPEPETLEVNGSENKEAISNITSNETEQSRSFLSLTGRIVDDLVGGGIFTSWAFYFVFSLTIVFVIIFFIRRYYYEKYY